MDAVITACRVRLRPILMTSLATIIGMIPMALKMGTGAEQYAPMARAIIGGLTSSVVLTIFIVPAAYLLVYGKRNPQTRQRSPRRSQMIPQESKSMTRSKSMMRFTICTLLLSLWTSSLQTRNAQSSAQSGKPGRLAIRPPAAAGSRPERNGAVERTGPGGVVRRAAAELQDHSQRPQAVPAPNSPMQLTRSAGGAVGHPE